MENNKRYTYQGSVYRFNCVVESNWKAETMAPSERKARVNLAYQYKKQHGFVDSTPVRFGGILKCFG